MSLYAIGDFHLIQHLYRQLTGLLPGGLRRMRQDIVNKLFADAANRIDHITDRKSTRLNSSHRL